MLVYFLLVIYQSISYHLDGMELFGSIRKALSTHVLAFMGFIVLVPLVSIAKYRNWLVAVLALVIGVSLLFAIMQWLSFDFAWQVASIINKNFIWLWGTSSPGFAMNSVSLGYQLLFISPVAISFAILADRRYEALRWLCAVGFPLFLLPIQSRSVSITFMFVAAAVLFFASRSTSLFFVDRLRTLIFVFVSVLSILLTTTIFGSLFTSKVFAPHSLNETIKHSVDQFMSCSTPDAACDSDSTIDYDSGAIRLLAIKIVIDSMESPDDYIFGPDMDKYKQLMPNQFDGLYPHNLIFNALLIGGLIGLVLVCLTYLLIFRMVYPLKLYLNDYVIFLAGLGLIAQVLNSMLHNDSLFFGSIYPWFIAAFILGRVLERNATVPNSGVLPRHNPCARSS